MSVTRSGSSYAVVGPLAEGMRLLLSILAAPLILTLVSLWPGPVLASERAVLVSGSVKAGSGHVVAEDDGAVYALPGKIALSASPGTRFKIFKATQNLELERGVKTKTFSVRLQSGRLDVEIPGDGVNQPALLITGPRKSAAIVRSGVATILAQEAYGVVVNREGQTLVSQGAGWLELRAGFTRVRDSRRPQGETEKTISEPGEISGRGLLAAFDGEAHVAGIGWPSAPGAARYQVLLQDTESGKKLLQSSTKLTELELTEKLAPGSYLLSVWSVDARGSESTKARTKAIRVVGGNLPEGSSVRADQAIFVAPRQRLSLKGVKGLKMTYGKADYWVEAPASVGLYRNQRTTITFKDPKNSETLSLVLLPRITAAKIQMQPRIPTWPNDTIRISVEMQDSRGPGAAKEAKPTFELRLGLKLLDVDWRQSGTRWSASIPPVAGAGPWVLRLTVKDDQGNTLAHDFLEIAEAKRPARQTLASR